MKYIQINKQVDKLKKELDKIKKKLEIKTLELLQTPVPGYDTCRPAICIIKQENLTLKDENNKKVKILAILNMLGNYYVITPPGKNMGYGFYNSGENLTTEEMIQIYEILSKKEYCQDRTGKHLRAINPWWFIDESHINETTAEIIGETPEEYLYKINNNPKVKQQNQEQK